MRKTTIMFDTNIIISAGIYGSTKLANLVNDISEEYEIVLSTAIIDELRRVIAKKWPKEELKLENFLNKLGFELINTPTILGDNYPKIRDVKDYPILASAIIGDVDVFITGDKDFKAINIERPEIMTISEFEEEYLN